MERAVVDQERQEEAYALLTIDRLACSLNLKESYCLNYWSVDLTHACGIHILYKAFTDVAVALQTGA